MKRQPRDPYRDNLVNRRSGQIINDKEFKHKKPKQKISLRIFTFSCLVKQILDKWKKNMQPLFFFFNMFQIWHLTFVWPLFELCVCVCVTTVTQRPKPIQPNNLANYLKNISEKNTHEILVLTGKLGCSASRIFNNLADWYMSWQL